MTMGYVSMQSLYFTSLMEKVRSKASFYHLYPSTPDPDGELICAASSVAAEASPAIASAASAFSLAAARASCLSLFASLFSCRRLKRASASASECSAAKESEPSAVDLLPSLPPRARGLSDISSPSHAKAAT